MVEAVVVVVVMGVVAVSDVVDFKIRLFNRRKTQQIPISWLSNSG